MYRINRVKSLSKSGNSKKDQTTNSMHPVNKEALLCSNDVEDVFEPPQELNVQETRKRVVEKDINTMSGIDFRQSTNYREESGIPSISMDKGRSETNNSFGGSTSQRNHLSSYPQETSDREEKVKKVSPPRGKGLREEKPDRPQNWSKRDVSSSEIPTLTNFRQSTSETASRQYESDTSLDENIDALLEVKYSLKP